MRAGPFTGKEDRGDHAAFASGIRCMDGSQRDRAWLVAADAGAGARFRGNADPFRERPIPASRPRAGSTASPRSQAPRSTGRTSVRPTSTAGRRTPPTPSWSVPLTQPISMRASTSMLSLPSEADRRGHGRRPQAGRHAGAAVLRWRPVLPGRADAALSRPAGGVAPVRELRRL